MDFYIYEHRRLDTGEIFYIGKGTKNRAWSKHNRNKYWHNIVNEFGYCVNILLENLSEDSAFQLESQLIKSKLPQANFTLGGDGGDTWTLLPEVDKTRLRNAARERATDPNGGVATAARLRKGKSKETDPGIKRMAKAHSENFSGRGNPMYGRSFWLERSEEYCEDVKSRISKSLKQAYRDNPRKYKVVVCPHCKKSGGQSNMTRYHFENCKGIK